MGWIKTSWMNIIGKDIAKVVVNAGQTASGMVDCNTVHKYMSLSIRASVVFGANPNNNAVVNLYCVDKRSSNKQDTIPVFSQEVVFKANSEQTITIPDIDVATVDALKVEVKNNDTNSPISVYVSSKAGYGVELLENIDENVKVSQNDVENGFLFDKVIGVENKVVLSEAYDGANEKLKIDVLNNVAQWNADKIKGVPVDDTRKAHNKILVFDEIANKLSYQDLSGVSGDKVRVSIYDAELGYLSQKVLGTPDRIVFNIENQGDDEKYIVDVGANIFDKTVDKLDNVQDGTIYSKVKGSELDQGRVKQLRAITNNANVSGDLIFSHLNNISNPHNVLTTQITDFNTAVQNHTDVAASTAHRNSTGNVHNVLTTQITDFNTAVQNHTDVAANTANRNKVKISNNDTTSNFLESKISGSVNKINVIKNNANGNENLQINIGVDIFDKVTNTLDNISDGTTYGKVKLSEIQNGQIVQLRAISGNTNITGDFVKNHIDTVNGNPHNVKGSEVPLITTTFNNKLSSSNNNVQSAMNALDDHVHIGAEITDLDNRITAHSDVSANTASRFRVKISANDTTTNYLENKILGTTNKISITKMNTGANENLVVNIGADIFDKAVNTLDNINNGVNFGKVKNTELSDGTIARIKAVSADVFLTGDYINTHILNSDRLFLDVKEPTGFVNRTESNITFNETTRTFTISPVSGSFNYYIKGVRYQKSAAEQIVIPNVVGSYFLFYNGVTLSYMTTWNESLIKEYVMVAHIYWNGGNAITFADERHGLQMFGDIHEYLHKTEGLKYISGLTLQGYALKTDTLAAISFGLSEGIMRDEDIEYRIKNGIVTNAFEMDIVDPAQMPVIYRNPDGVWVQDSPTDYPYKNTGSGRISYNFYNISTSLWEQVEVTNGYYVSYTVVATNCLKYPLKMVQGHKIYATELEALSGAASEYAGMTPFPANEMKILYRLILQTKSSYTNQYKVVIAAVQDLRVATMYPIINNVTALAPHSYLADLDYSTSGHTGFGRLAHEATINPTINNDKNDTANVGKFFRIGDFWINTLTDTLWTCTDNTPGAALWVSGKLQASDTDTTPATLNNKLIGTTNKIVISKNNPNANENLQINIGTDVFDKVTNTLDNINDGTTYGKVRGSELSNGQVQRIRAVTGNVDVSGDTINNHLNNTNNPHNVTASQISVIVTGFNKELQVGDNTVQKALDRLDDHVHEANETGVTTTLFNQVLTASDNTVQKALDTLDDYSYEQNFAAEALFTTTSTTYVQRVRFTTDALQAGNYAIDVMSNLYLDARDKMGYWRWQIDDTIDIIESTLGRTQNNNAFSVHTAFFYVTLTAGIHNIDFDLRSGDGTALSAANVRLRIRRTK